MALERIKVTECVCGYPEHCACGEEEKRLRMVSAGGAQLTKEERFWCLGEICVVEGWSDYKPPDGDDAQLARDVLSAWTDYARDKCGW